MAGALNDLVDSANGGLSDLRRPLMSAAADDSGAPDSDLMDHDSTLAMDRMDLSASSRSDGELDVADLGAGDLGVTDVVGGEDATGHDVPLGDATPAFGGELPFVEITSEVPLIRRRDSDAFGIGGSNP